MQTQVIDIKGHWTSGQRFNEVFSFCAFLNYLKQRIEVEKTIKSEFYRFVLNKFNKRPQLVNNEIAINEVGKHEELLELLYTILSPAINDDSKIYWALSTPIPSKIIYCTNDFYKFLTGYNALHPKPTTGSSGLFQQNQLDYIYRLILQKLYNFPADLINDVVYPVVDPKTNLSKFYRIHINSKFVEITADKELPELNPEIIEPCIYDGAGMEVLKDIIPLSMFSFKGFSVITIREITAEHAIETIRAALVNNVKSQKLLYKQVIQSLQTLASNAAIKFGLLPFIKVNGELIFDAEECAHSFIIRLSKKYKVPQDVYSSFITAYAGKPGPMFFSTISNKKVEQYPFLKVFQRAGIKSYAILPVYYNRHLTGIMEVCADQRIIFYEKLLSRLQTAIPLISQLLKDSADILNSKLENIIKTRFTTLQPSVERKFNEAAWQFIKKNKGDAELQAVTFKNVYPLYGAIDMRNSTIEHNAAFKKDLATLSDVLTKTIKALAGALPTMYKATLSAQLNSWKRKLKKLEKANEETQLKEFLYARTGPYLLHIKEEHPIAAPIINEYLKAVEEETGKVHFHRNQLELSIKKINRVLTRYFDGQVNKLQKIYPCYFEKFRSDGIEYDVYIGQDMAAKQLFKPVHLKKFRQWQLKSMIEVSILTNALLPKLPVPIPTASLIFVHSGQIDICFRSDERRFDVEGYYNIRYEVIKKRIDKVLVKNSGERLTQPGKIAIVYFNDDEIEVYLSYIKKLQTKGALKKNLEYVTLEELQGVSGLKALRVSINYPKDK
jgi:hypothetical protein